MSTISDLISLTKPRLSATVIFTAAGGWWLAPVDSHWTVGVFRRSWNYADRVGSQHDEQLSGKR